MRMSFLLLTFWWTLPAFGFSMIGPSGMDMQSAALMQSCRDSAEDAALKTELRYSTAQCGSSLPSINSANTRLTGLALEKKGFVYEIDVDSGCSRAVRYEVEVGPTSNGNACVLLSNPKVLGILESAE